jgi:hypothetical protein
MKDKKQIKSVFHFTRSRVATRQFQAMGHNWMQLVQPNLEALLDRLGVAPRLRDVALQVEI